ncbi:MAG: Fe-S protein assembly co-chaperone HscB [Planctomycetes bacterium]|nr:Fe-S protein assembly co-chaperone HscB [Planctomycetota bacterium]
MCCAGCGALNALPPSMFTYFELFGIEQTYDVDPDELRRKYLDLSRSIHPDVAGRNSDQERKQALALSSGLNRAYDTLRNPVSRAEYLLQFAGGPSPADDKTVPGEMLAEVMMLREEIDEAARASDAAALKSIKADVTSRHDEALARITAICHGAGLADPAAQKELRQQLNAIKYWNNLLDQIPTPVET